MSFSSRTSLTQIIHLESEAGPQTLEPQSGTAVVLRSGDELMIKDAFGQQVSDLFCVDLHDRSHRFSAGRTMDYADTLFLTTGHTLYSNRSERMLTIIHDDCGRHDLLMPPCSLKMFQIVAHNSRHHPSCHENLWTSLAPFDIEADWVDCTFNVFMNVTIDAVTGALRIEPPLSKAGDAVHFRAERDLIIGLTACSHEETNAGTCKPITYQIARKEAPGDAHKKREL